MNFAPARSNARVVLMLGTPGLAARELTRRLARTGRRVSLIDPFASDGVLGPIGAGASAWRARLSRLLRAGHDGDVIPIGPLAHELLLGDAGLATPPTRIIGPTPASHAIASDRRAALDVARRAGLRTPQTLYLRRDSEVALESLPLPCVLRPAVAAAIVDDEPVLYSSRLVRNVRELDAKLRDDLPRSDVLLQVLMHGVRVDLCLCALEGRLLALVAVSQRGAVLRPETAMLAAAHRIVAALSWTGFMTVQCSRETEGLAFLDLACGPQNALVASCAAGVDQPRIMLDALQGKGLGEPVLPRAANCSTAITLSWRSSEGILYRLAERTRSRVRATAWGYAAKCLQPPILHRDDRILFVCQGNINRSVVAEQVLRARGFHHVASASLLAMSGRRPSAAAQAHIEQHLGIDASGLRSRSAAHALDRSGPFDVVVCFERRHAIELLARWPQLEGRLFLLSSWGDGHGPADIEDPHERSHAQCRACFDRVERLLERAVARGDVRGQGGAARAPWVAP
jgi:protein-tyrosine-phosphatase